MSKPHELGDFAFDFFPDCLPEDTKFHCDACNGLMQKDGGSIYYKRSKAPAATKKRFNGGLITICADCLGSASRIYPAKHRAGDPICLTETQHPQQIFLPLLV